MSKARRPVRNVRDIATRMKQTLYVVRKMDDSRNKLLFKLDQKVLRNSQMQGKQKSALVNYALFLQIL